MGQGLSDITFEEWVRHIFDHPVTDPAWYWNTNSDWWSNDASPATTVLYVIQLFENAGIILAPYSDAQINHGFGYLDHRVEYMFTLRESAVPLDERLHWIHSIYDLFEQVFAVRCSKHAAHLIMSNSPSTDEIKVLNSTCYMWWDIAPLNGAMEVENLPQICDAVLDVMRKTLELNSIACQESALHGLGHWQLYFPIEIYQIIDNWLKTHTSISEQLKNYAHKAQIGYVL